MALIPLDACDAPPEPDVNPVFADRATNVPSTAAAGEFRIHCLNSPDAIAPLHDVWTRLAGGVPFRRWEWLVPWWKHFRGRRDELLVLAVTDSSGTVVGIAPWYIQRGAVYGPVIRFLGSGLVCSDYLTILHEPRHETVVAKALADWFRRHGPRHTWIELGGVCKADPIIGEFTRRLGEQGYVVDERPEESCWRVELTSSWEEYLKGLSKSRREKARQLVRRVLDTSRVKVRTADCHRTLREGLAILTDLHQKRRNSLGQPGCFASDAFREFLAEAAQAFFDLGRLRLQWIEIDSRPVVAEIDFADDDALYMYQSGIDPECAEERPGWLGTIASLRHAIDARYRGYDFLRGDETYKRHWRAESKPLTMIRAFPKTPRAQLIRWLWKNGVGRLLIRAARALNSGAAFLLRRRD